MAVIVIGLLGAPLTAQVARMPDLLHEAIVPALAAVVLAATPPSASMQVTATPTARRRMVRTVSCPFLLGSGGTCPYRVDVSARRPVYPGCSRTM